MTSAICGYAAIRFPAGICAPQQPLSVFRLLSARQPCRSNSIHAGSTMNCHQGNPHFSLLRRLLTRSILTACLLSACTLPRGDGAIPAPAKVTVDCRRFNRNAPLASRTDFRLQRAQSTRAVHSSRWRQPDGENSGWRRGRSTSPPAQQPIRTLKTPAGLVRIPVGLDGIAVVVHTDNPVKALTLVQVRDLYRGRALNWAEVGGVASDVLLVSREDGSATRDLFEKRVMDKDRVALTAVVMSTQQQCSRVCGLPTRDAIGYVTLCVPCADWNAPRGEWR